jgi:zinc D-Ala-D-Ala carboxypeptidase
MVTVRPALQWKNSLMEIRGSDMAGKLSEHFTLIEMIRSEYAARMGITNNPSASEIEQLRLLCVEVLEPVRSKVGSPVIITSGFRCPEVNKGIGGSPTSQHVKGQAADGHIPHLGIKETVIKIIKARILFDQLIYEFGETGWFHISRSDNPRQQVLTAYKDANGFTRYTTFTF